MDPITDLAGTRGAPHSERPCVLFVDDHPEFLREVAPILSDEYSVNIATSGVQALELIQRALPELVLADAMMPGLGGTALLKALRADPRTRAVPVILLSEHERDEARTEAFELGADGYLTKPFSLRELRARIRAALESTRLRITLARTEALAQAEEAATRERAEILESITDAFYALDEQWRFTYLNQRALDHFRRTREQLLGQLIWTLCPDEEAAIIRREFERVIEHRCSATFETLSPISGRWIEMHAYPSRKGLTVCFQDIEKRKQALADREQALRIERQARQEAEHVGLMKDEFLATLSHELRTPLNAILGWATVLRHKGAADADFDRAVETIERNARLQATIISDLLDMSRIVSGRIRLDVQRVQLQDVVHAAIDAIEPAAGAKNLGLTTGWGSSVAPVRADPERLQQVFWNLLNNAAKYTPEGGRIRINLERVDAHVEVRIQDTGIGIAAEFLPHVFDRFRQADSSTTRRTGGLGLGLSIVKSLVELHGGSVQAQSDGPDRGSTFIVRLPVAPPDTGSTASNRMILSEPPDQGELELPQLLGTRVLVVDDDLDARTLVSRVLEDHGARVRVAGSGPEALQLLATERFDVLVSDIGMPEMDGYELLRRLRQHAPELRGTLPAIALTAFAQASDRERALHAGFQDHIAKPVDSAELLNALKRLPLSQR